jgi:RNA polymerase sigma-70 factor (ECF subfamily)
MARNAGRDELIGNAVEQMEGPLLRYAFHMTRNREQARDIVQEAFLRLCRSEPEMFRDRIEPWLYTVCRNLALDAKRMQSRTKQLSKLETDHLAGDNPQPPAALAIEESRGEVCTLISGLPPNQQEAIWLKFREGLKYREIAAVMGTSISNVGFLIHKGINTIRKELSLPARAAGNEV